MPITKTPRLAKAKLNKRESNSEQHDAIQTSNTTLQNLNDDKQGETWTYLNFQQHYGGRINHKMQKNIPRCLLKPIQCDMGATIQRKNSNINYT